MAQQLEQHSLHVFVVNHFSWDNGYMFSITITKHANNQPPSPSPLGVSAIQVIRVEGMASVLQFLVLSHCILLN